MAVRVEVKSEIGTSSDPAKVLVYLDCFIPFLDSPSQRAGRLIASEDYNIFGAVCKMLEIFNGSASCKHSGGCDNQARPSFYNCLSFCGRAYPAEYRRDERIIILKYLASYA